MINQGPAVADRADSGLNSRASSAELWVRYCGFLDLSLAEFMAIQQRLLSEQLVRMRHSSLWSKVTGGEIWDPAEFRRCAPVTHYDDYAERLRAHDETCLSEKPQYWMHTSGRSAAPKAIPYTAEGYRRLAEAGVASLALSCARHHGDWRAKSGLRVVYNMPPKPFYSGYMTQSIEELIGVRFMPSSAEADKMTFEEKVRVGFKLALKYGLDVAASQTSVLLKMAEGFSSQSNQKSSVTKLLREPAMTARLARAWLRARAEKRAILPRDLWEVKSLIAYGMDTHVMRERLIEYWGVEPYEFYGSTETCALAMQTWARRGLHFTPYSVFIEFAPEEEIHRWLKDRSHLPKTVLMDEVKAGETYELLVTSFYGLPFARYRMEDSFKCVGLTDEGAGIHLPQFEFAGRSQDLIDLAGFAQLTEKDLVEALVATGIRTAGWSARKEGENGAAILRFYIEPSGSDLPEDLAERIHQALARKNENFSDLESMLGLRPIRVTRLASGSFRAYYEAQKAAGAPLVKLKPSAVNAVQESIDRLQAISRGLEQKGN
jgi:phenylacetate-coenzyme A ligase PaaK-like adenylate-forming protein